MKRNPWAALAAAMCVAAGVLACGTPIPLEPSATTGAASSPASTCAIRSYRYIFATGAMNTTSDFGSVSGADSKCNAVKPSCVSSAKAMIVDTSNRRACSTANCGGGSGEHIDWVLAANQEYRRTDDTTVIGTTNSVGIFGFPLTNALTGAGETWTGLNTNWTTGSTCSNWTNATGSPPNGGVGLGTTTDNTSLYRYDQFCNRTDVALYCVEQ